jgi:membrane fusion protein, multidrug efflux system
MTNGQATAPRKLSPRARLTWIIVLVIVVAIAGHYGINLLMDSLLHESTDDAFVDGHIVAISSRVAGHVEKVLIIDNQEVKKGDLLIEIDPRDYAARAKAAEAALLAARAGTQQVEADIVAAQTEADRTKTDLARYTELSPASSVSKQQLDSVSAAARSSQARLDAVTKLAAVSMARIAEAAAALETANLQLSYTKVYAPQDGRVTKRSVEAGAFVDRGQPLMAIVPDNVWVTANFKETQLTTMRPGQPATIEVDAFPSMRFKAHVDSIQDGTGARFSLLPSENATGNYVKVVQRVPVKLVFDSDPNLVRQLSPGMSVVPRVLVVDVDSREKKTWWKRWIGL